MAAQPQVITIQDFADYEEYLILYCILITGFNEKNNRVIASAIALFNRGDQEYIILTQFLHIRRHDIDITFNQVIWKLKYLALFCFVYATLDESSNMSSRANKNIAGLTMSKTVAPGWAWCLLDYVEYGFERNIGIRGDLNRVKQTNSIIATALTNQYIINDSFQFRQFCPSGESQVAFNGAASDIMRIAHTTLDQVVKQTDSERRSGDNHIFWDNFEGYSSPSNFNDLKHLFYSCFNIVAMNDLFPPASQAGGRRKQSKRRKRKY